MFPEKFVGEIPRGNSFLALGNFVRFGFTSQLMTSAVNVVDHNDKARACNWEVVNLNPAWIRQCLPKKNAFLGNLPCLV